MVTTGDCRNRQRVRAIDLRSWISVLRRIDWRRSKEVRFVFGLSGNFLENTIGIMRAHTFSGVFVASEGGSQWRLLGGLILSITLLLCRTSGASGVIREMETIVKLLRSMSFSTSTLTRQMFYF